VVKLSKKNGGKIMTLKAQKGGGKPFGWHSGTITCKDANILGDLTIQDDIIFGGISAGKLAVTGGIDMQSTTSAIGIDLGGTFATSAINIDGTCTKGIYIKNTAIKADGTGYAIQIQGGSATIKGIFVGADSNSAGSGIKLAGASWDTSQGNGFYCDDGGTALTGYTETMTVRMLTTTAVASGDVSTAALHPDLTLNANYTGTGGLSSIWGNTTIMTGKTINLNGSLGDVGGATFGLDLNGTLAANSHGCGCSVGIGGSGTKTGIICGYRIRAATGTVDWDGILSIEDGDGSWTGMTKTAASNTATMTNSPKTGNPAYWLKIYIAETAYYFPVWTD